MEQFYKSILEQDPAPIVVCSTEHIIVYMNPAAEMNYRKHGGYALVGRSILDCHSPQSRDALLRVVSWFAQSPDHNRVYTFHNEKKNKDVYMVALRDDAGNLIGYYEKHEFRNPETMAVYEMK